jgi:hypothetical protein
LYTKPGNPDQAGNSLVMDGDTVAAGEPFTIYGHAFDTLGWRSDWDGLISLELIDPQNRAELVSGGKGSITILPKGSPGVISVSATFINPEDPYGQPVKVTVDLVIGPGEALADSAFTADVDGDGYIDRIDLLFNDKVLVNNDLKNFIEVKYEGVFQIDSLQLINSGSGIRIFLKERTGGQLQTGWRPTVDVRDAKGFSPVSDLESKDGAGPVVNRAKYYQGNLSDGQNPAGTPDTIKVTISEPVKWPSNANPNQIFRYYHARNPVENPFSSMKIVDDSTALLIVSDNLTVEHCGTASS